MSDLFQVFNFTSILPDQTAVRVGRRSRDGRFGFKLGQIGPKFDKFGPFFRSDFSAFGAGAPNALKSDLKKGPD